MYSSKYGHGSEHSRRHSPPKPACDTTERSRLTWIPRCLYTSVLRNEGVPGRCPKVRHLFLTTYEKAGKTYSKPAILPVHLGGGFRHLDELGADSLHGRQRSLDSTETTITRPIGGECVRMMYDVGSCSVGKGQMTRSRPKLSFSHIPHLYASQRTDHQSTCLV